MTPGETSSDEEASTAHGRTAAIASATFSGPRPPASTMAIARASRASAGRPLGCALPVRRIRLAPGEVEEPRDRLAVPVEDRLASAHLPFLHRVHLVEGGVAGAGLADPHGDGEGRLRDGENSLCRPRALRREHEAEQIGACLGGDRDVLLARQSAHLDQRARQQLAQLGGRVRRPHQRRPDEDRVRTGELGCGALRTRLDPRLRDHDPVVGHRRDELELRVTVDRERRQVARVDADHWRFERDRPRELCGVVGLDERVQAQARGVGQEACSTFVVQVSEDQQRSIRAGLAWRCGGARPSRRSPSPAAAHRSRRAPRGGRPTSRRSGRRRARRSLSRRRARRQGRCEPDPRPAGGPRPTASAA